MQLKNKKGGKSEPGRDKRCEKRHGQCCNSHCSNRVLENRRDVIVDFQISMDVYGSDAKYAKY